MRFALACDVALLVHVAALFLLRGPRAHEAAREASAAIPIEVEEISDPSRRADVPDPPLPNRAPHQVSAKVQGERHEHAAAYAAGALIYPKQPDEIIVGKAPRYPGGVTRQEGSPEPSDQDGDGEGTGGGSITEPAHPLERDWHCRWPTQAREAPIFEMRVHVRVSVNRAGQPTNMTVYDHPGMGFEEATRACGMRQRYRPALDGERHAIAGKTNRFVVIFYTY